MCNLYSITTNQAAIIALFRVINRYVGNLPPMPGVFPDYPAPVVRNDQGGEREMVMMRWGMPPPPRAGGFPVTNIRNTTSPHWRGWLKPENRCLVSFNSFAEYAPEPNPETKKKDVVWFALNDDRPRLSSSASSSMVLETPLQVEHAVLAIRPLPFPVLWPALKIERASNYLAGRGVRCHHL
jgi:putative SOS response-associated peptidase YedK